MFFISPLDTMTPFMTSGIDLGRKTNIVEEATRSEIESLNTPWVLALQKASRQMRDLAVFLKEHPPQRPKPLPPGWLNNIKFHTVTQDTMDAVEPPPKLVTTSGKSPALKVRLPTPTARRSPHLVIESRKEPSQLPVPSAQITLQEAPKFLVVTRDGERQISFEGSFYYICNTRADGACAIHALLGQKINSEYVYENNQTARTFYCEQVAQVYEKSELLTHCLYDGAQQYLADSANEYVNMIFIRAPKAIGKLRKVKEWLKNYRQEKKVELEKALDQVRSLQDRVIQESIANAVKCSWKDLFLSQKHRTILQNHFDGVVQALGNDPLASSLGSIRKELDVIDQTEEESITSSLLDPEVKKAYFQACMDPTYQFSLEELHVMAILFGRQVTLFIRGQDKPVIYNANTALQNIVIYYAFNHYSRCTKIL